MKSYTVKQNHISSVVSEILRYKDDNYYTDIKILFAGTTEAPTQPPVTGPTTTSGPVVTSKNLYQNSIRISHQKIIHI